MAQQKILVVDDNDEHRGPLKTALIAEGFEVAEATNGKEGLSAALREKPALILLDISMPEVNGHEMLHELRKDAWGKDVPVILLTSADDATNITHAVGHGGDDYLIKSQTSLRDITIKIKQQLAGYHE